MMSQSFHLQLLKILSLWITKLKKTECLDNEKMISGEKKGLPLGET